MKNFIALISTAAAMAFSANAFATDESAKATLDYKKNGGYEATTNANGTTEDGTSKMSKTKENVDVDSSGKATKTITAKSSSDPKGFMNKKTHNGKVKIKDKKNGGYKKTVDDEHRCGRYQSQREFDHKCRCRQQRQCHQDHGIERDDRSQGPDE